MEDEYHQMWRIVKMCDLVAGTNSLHDPSQKLSKVQYFFRIATATGYFTFMSVLLYNAYCFRKNLLLLIIAGSMFVIFITVGMVGYSLIFRREDYITVVNWCKKVIEIDTPIFVQTRKNWIRLVKINMVACYLLGFSSALFPAILGLIFAPGEFIAPLPFNLPYLDPNTWTAFTLNTLLQIMAFFIWDTLGGVIYPFFGLHYYTTNGFVDDLKERIEALGREILEKERLNRDTKRKMRVIKMFKGTSSEEGASYSNTHKDFAKSIKEIVAKYNEVVE